MYSLLLTSILCFIAHAFTEDDDLSADGANFCCKAYDTKGECMKSNDNYECYWLNKKDDDEKKVIRKYGERCLGKKFVKCKIQNGLKAKCFIGGSAGEPMCDYATTPPLDSVPENNEIMADINVGQVSSGTLDVDIDSDSLFADDKNGADNACCNVYDNRQDCRRNQDGYQCYWFDKRNPQTKPFLRKTNAQCVSTRLASCLFLGKPYKSCPGAKNTDASNCQFGDEDDQEMYEFLNVIEDEDDDLSADGANFCCKAYDTKGECMKSNDNYECYWLNKKDDDEKKIIRKYGERCLGRKFVKCKIQNGLKAKCFIGGSAGEPMCDYVTTPPLDFVPQNNEIMADINVGQVSSGYKWILDYKLLGAVCVVILLGAYYVYYKRNNKDNKYALIDQYGATTQDAVQISY